jgi:hypothetical protein
VKDKVIDKSNLFKIKKNINTLRSSSFYGSNFDTYLENCRPTVREVDLVRDTIDKLLIVLEQALFEMSRFYDEIDHDTVELVLLALCERDKKDLQEQIKRIESLISALSKGIGNNYKQE